MHSIYYIVINQREENKIKKMSYILSIQKKKCRKMKFTFGSLTHHQSINDYSCILLLMNKIKDEIYKTKKR